MTVSDSEHWGSGLDWRAHGITKMFVLEGPSQMSRSPTTQQQGVVHESDFQSIFSLSSLLPAAAACHPLCQGKKVKLGAEWG